TGSATPAGEPRRHKAPCQSFPQGGLTDRARRSLLRRNRGSSDPLESALPTDRYHRRIDPARRLMLQCRSLLGSCTASDGGHRNGNNPIVSAPQPAGEHTVSLLRNESVKNPDNPADRADGARDRADADAQLECLGRRQGRSGAGDAFVRRDITPLGTKVAGLVRDLRVSGYQEVRKGDELVRLEVDDYRAQVAQAVAAVD